MPKKLPKAAAASTSTATTNPKDKPFIELGVSGLTRYGRTSLVYEEFLPELAPARAPKVYREMRDNDPVIGAIMFAVEMLIRNVTWQVQGKDPALVQFVEECRQDMSHTWEEFLAEVLSMLVYGYAYHEIVYKQRNGDSQDPTQRSRYKDKRIGWRKLALRSQDTRQDWEFDEDGGVQAFVQSSPPTYALTSIPIVKALLFRTTSHKTNPEGRSMLRNSYRPWYFKRRIEEIEAIGVERDLAGLPIIYRSAEIASAYDAELKKILRNIRRDEQEGILLPMSRDDKGNLNLELKLLSTGGQRQFNTTQIVDRYNRAIAMTCLADFILLGQQAVGSFALSSNKTALFATALGAWLKAIAAVMNRYAIPRLLELNSLPVDDPPQLVPGDVESVDLKEIGAFITQLAGAGMPLFPDTAVENMMRNLAGLPEKAEESVGKEWRPRRNQLRQPSK